MKKEGKQHAKINAEKQEELQTVNDFSNKENTQPVPQPKDYDEIEY
ncbi:hypothetical protein BAOM_2000 [Peribacillus asahii]|uniref:Uncharacterized protein n=1 Tax=Peribacillus asahii TaxID=228899 RepID=A0A3T0KQC9_9BACI|nr:hypothetical protein [Peribacillus asahii]AZV42609.1 hypothetical protein BAOM_2000 [Peribacillus asahii]